MVGVVVDDATDPDDLQTLRDAVFGAGMVPLVIAPHGGEVAGTTAQRTFATARSVEFDVLLLAASPAPAPDALPGRDAKAGASGDPALDPRVKLLVEECWRHAKVVGAWGSGATALRLAGTGEGDVGVVVGEGADEVFSEVQELMAAHRVWERFPAVVV